MRVRKKDHQGGYRRFKNPAEALDCHALLKEDVKAHLKQTQGQK